MSSLNEFYVTIATPQHKNGEIWYWLVQRGYYDDETKLFRPSRGGHPVQFHELDDIQKSCDKAEELIRDGKEHPELYTEQRQAYLP